LLSSLRTTAAYSPIKGDGAPLVRTDELPVFYRKGNAADKSSCTHAEAKERLETAA